MSHIVRYLFYSRFCVFCYFCKINEYHLGEIEDIVVLFQRQWNKDLEHLLLHFCPLELWGASTWNKIWIILKGPFNGMWLFKYSASLKNRANQTESIMFMFGSSFFPKKTPFMIKGCYKQLWKCVWKQYSPINVFAFKEHITKCVPLGCLPMLKP